MSSDKINRRKFIVATSAAGIAATVLPSWACTGTKNLLQAAAGVEEIPYTQQPLLYNYKALEPAIDAMTMEIHYTKHAAAYTKNLTDAALAEGVDVQLLRSISKIEKK